MNNNRVKIKDIEVLSSNHYVLRKVNFEYLSNEGEWQKQSREAYDRGNGAAILLYNRAQGTVILTQQFRMPTFLNGNDTGMMIEVCAGLLDKDNPDDAIRRETEEETGYKITEVKKVFEAYMSPGSVTEILHLYVAEYSKEMKVNEGGGAEGEQENIVVMEIPFTKAIAMMNNGEIKDAKSIMLLLYAQVNNLTGK